GTTDAAGLGSPFHPPRVGHGPAGSALLARAPRSLAAARSPALAPVVAGACPVGDLILDSGTSDSAAAGSCPGSRGGAAGAGRVRPSRPSSGPADPARA